MSQLRRSPSPSLPTVEEFQRTSVKEDQQVLKEFLRNSPTTGQRSRSLGDVRKASVKKSSGRSSGSNSNSNCKHLPLPSSLSKKSFDKSQSSPSLYKSSRSLLSASCSGSGNNLRNASFAAIKKTDETASFQNCLDRKELAKQKLEQLERLQNTLQGLEEELSRTRVGAWPRSSIIMDASTTNSAPSVSTSTTQERLKGVSKTTQRPAFSTDIYLNGTSNHSNCSRSSGSRTPPRTPTQRSQSPKPSTTRRTTKKSVLGTYDEAWPQRPAFVVSEGTNLNGTSNHSNCSRSSGSRTPPRTPTQRSQSPKTSTRRTTKNSVLGTYDEAWPQRPAFVVSAGTTDGSLSTPVRSSLIGPPRTPVRMISPALSVSRKKPATELQEW
jgi:hypothetical protein